MITEHNFGTGAIQKEPVENISTHNEIGGDTAPFDWNLGYDIIDTLFHKANINSIPVKNQGKSGSCGGQASSYLVEVLDAIRDGHFVEKSARFIYAPNAVVGGGSSEEGLMNTILTKGSADESLVSSYEANLPPSEAFMEKTSDFDTMDFQNALQSKGLTPVYLDPTDIDGLAATIRDKGGFVMGVCGQNNGTWLSAFPNIPTISPKECWHHWVYFGKAKLINGKKYLGFINSWGNIGENGTGWQYISEEYLRIHTWGAWTIVLINPPKISYTFNVTMKVGDSNSSIAMLQTKLKELGLFPKDQAITNYYGNITKQAVIKFQELHGLPKTGFCGKLTIAALNKLN